MLDALNDDCFCVSLDRDALRRSLDADGASAGLASLIEARCPHLFAALPVFVSRPHVEAMARIVRAVEEVVALPAYRDQVLRDAPAIARSDPGARGAFIGYDFHLSGDGPKLIEVNTNAGGALLNAALARAQRACCDDVSRLVSGPVPVAALEGTLHDMFLAEWRHAGRSGRPQRIAIVDDRPLEQYLYPEFVLFQRLFQARGIDAAIAAPEELSYAGGRLLHAGRQVDVVYNRLTDFYFEDPAHSALRAAYEARTAVVTPHPRAHALYANKRNLALLSGAEALAALGVRDETLEILTSGIPRTRVVTPAIAEALWAERRHLFFKPAAGHGSKAAYRGEKITRRVWDEIRNGDYVAQALVPPSLRNIAAATPLKLDVRNYVYEGAVQLLAARLYQGQTTNMRTPGGGFAPVLTTPTPSPEPGRSPGRRRCTA